MYDWLFLINMHGDTVGQILFSVAAQQLEFHRRVAKICCCQVDDSFFALLLLILGKNSGLRHRKTMGSAPNDYNLQTNCEFGCLASCMGWLLAFARRSSSSRRCKSRTDGSARGMITIAGGRIHPRA